jgi:hypothetical protein
MIQICNWNLWVHLLLPFCNLSSRHGSVLGERKRKMSIAIGIVIGGLAGFANYKFVGCATGACPLSSNPWIAIVFGMVFGGLIGGSFRTVH